MPNDSRSRRYKREKEKKRKDKKDPKPLRRKQAADASSSDKEDIHADEALAVSVSHLGAKPGSKALDNSLSAFASLPSSAEAKESLDGKKNSSVSLSPEDSEGSGNLSDDCEEVNPTPRPLSPSQYFGSLMKPSGSREKLFALAATASPASLGSTSLSLSTTFPLRQDSTTDKEEETDSDGDRWVGNQQRLRPPPADESGKSAGSPKTPAGSSSSSSLSSASKQETARQVAAELIRLGDTSLSAPLFSTSGAMDNLLPSQVNCDLEVKGQRMPVFTEEQRARLQKSRADRAEPLNSRELMGRVIHTLRLEYISDDENSRMSAEFKEHVKGVLAPLETTLANSATRLEEHHTSSMEQHERLIKDAHDRLTEASENFKAALTQQVHVMQMHNDMHVVMVETTEDLATHARKQFSSIIFGNQLEMAEDEGGETSRQARIARRTYTETLLDEAHVDLKKRQASWVEERRALNEKIKQQEDEREKLLDQISDVGVKNYRRKQERVKERAVSSRIAE
jgi:hypothetical protein